MNPSLENQEPRSAIGPPLDVRNVALIISHRHKFIFMHSRKTAGSSVTAALNPFLGPRDIQLGAWPETIAGGGRFNRKALLVAMSDPRLLWRRSAAHSRQCGRLAVSPEAVNRITKHHFCNRHGFSHGAHARASEVRAFAPDAWDSYFKFAIVRNPWTHAVSDYCWRMHLCKQPNVSFADYLRRLADPERPDPEGLRPPLMSNWEIYAIDDEIAVDRVGRYEDLSEEIAAFGAQLGLPLALGGHRAKAGIRDARKSPAEYYDAESVELVRDIYAREIAAFGYAPPF